ncbi:GRB2-associated-binding protein 3 [Scyliorhinus canicula]|uniref:GRB2-associated-binding protein 3 n=1 Tax=Scyliorhinus canicula TaxID=7830 RepID=UPI0018F5A453|nr:GRB2-associated-binding protein 3 [Scyliorhinus canicula]
MSAEDVVYTGWLIKSPPEKKLKRYAWRKRWFVLRSGRLSGNPDVLEYYKTQHSKKPLRMINLTECENIEAGLKLSKKEFHNNYVFEVKTPARTFYLVAKTEDEMNRWVRHISLICGFSSSDDGTDSLGSSSPTTSSSLQPSPAVSTHTSQSATRDQFPSTQDSVMEAESRKSESESTLSTVMPLDYLILSQCETKSINIVRSNSCSPCDRLLDHSFELTGSDDAQENLQLRNGTPTQMSCNVPLYKNLQDSQVVMLSNQDQSGPSSASSSPLSVYSFSQIFNFDKNHNTLPFGVAGIHLLSNTPPPRPPKPNQLTEREKTHKVIQNGDGAYAINPAPVPVPKRIPLSSLEKTINWKDTEECNLQPFTDFQGNCILSPDEGFNLNVLKLPDQQCSTMDSTDDSYVPMNPGSSPVIPAADCTSDGYIPMSPACTNLVLPTVTTDNLPLPTLATDVEPPPVNRNLKPRVRKIKPPPLDLTNLSTIRGHYNHSCVCKTWSMPFRRSTANCITPESQCNSARSFYSTLNGENDENYTAMERSSSVYNGSSQWPRTLNLDYLALDFNATSPSPVQKKPFLSSMLEERVDYVQVDEQKTQALQNTKQEWTDVRQSCNLSKTLK